MNDLEKFELRQVQNLTANSKKIPAFDPGDTVRVNVKIIEAPAEDAKKGTEPKTRIQAYEGVCIARGGKGVNLTFTVRKISYGEGVERIFPLYSPTIDSIELVRRGTVRRSKLYYLRDRSGKSARITERAADLTDNESADETPASKAAAHEKKAAVG